MTEVRRRWARSDRRLTMTQAREIRASTLSCKRMALLLKERDRVHISSVAVWKIRHFLCYREYPE